MKKRLEGLRSTLKPQKDAEPKQSKPNAVSAPAPVPTPAPLPRPALPTPSLKKPPVQRLQKLIDSNPNIKKLSEKLDTTKIGKKIKEGLKNLGLSIPEPKSANEILAEKLVSMHDLKKKLTDAKSSTEKLKHFLELSSMMENF